MYAFKESMLYYRNKRGEITLATLHNYFNDFHERIKLEMDDKEVLRDKRTAVEKAINDNILLDFNYSFFNQGSYSTHTGTKPIEGDDYDIDRGMVIQATEEELSVKKAKRELYNALVKEFGEANVFVKVPCVTVIFPKADIHVDIAIYRKENEDYYLGKGKLNSLSDNIFWEKSDPQNLRDKINSAQSETDDRRQFRRIIRYLKRWKDLKFKGEDQRPNGIGLSIFALNRFEPSYSRDAISYIKNYDDVACLKNVVKKMIDDFVPIYGEEGFYPRIRVMLPVDPYTDVYSRVSENQMKKFKEKLELLYNALDEAIKMSDIHDATTLLQKYFGEDLEIVPQEETANSFVKSAIINDYPSA